MSYKDMIIKVATNQVMNGAEIREHTLNIFGDNNEVNAAPANYIVSGMFVKIEKEVEYVLTDSDIDDLKLELFDTEDYKELEKALLNEEDSEAEFLAEKVFEEALDNWSDSSASMLNRLSDRLSNEYAELIINEEVFAFNSYGSKFASVEDFCGDISNNITAIIIVGLDTSEVGDEVNFVINTVNKHLALRIEIDYEDEEEYGDY